MQELWDLYLLHRQAEGYSQATINKLGWAWRKFANREVSEASVMSWHKSMFDQGLKQGTVRTHAAALYGFFKWCRDRGYISFDPPKPPPAPKPDRGSLSQPQVMAFIQASNTGRNRLRNRALVYLLLATGLRLGEVGRLLISDVDITSGLVHVRAATSKSRRSRVIPLGTQARAALQEYILFGRQGSTELYLFLSESGSPIGLRGIQLVIKRAAKKAKLKGVGPHLLRHTFATQSLLKGASAFHVKAMLGHASISSTEVYVDMAAVQDAAIHQRWTALDRLFP